MCIQGQKRGKNEDRLLLFLDEFCLSKATILNLRPIWNSRNIAMIRIQPGAIIKAYGKVIGSLVPREACVSAQSLQSLRFVVVVVIIIVVVVAAVLLLLTFLFVLLLLFLCLFAKVCNIKDFFMRIAKALLRLCQMRILILALIISLSSADDLTRSSTETISMKYKSLFSGKKLGQHFNRLSADFLPSMRNVKGLNLLPRRTLSL